ncbi:discoidin domain-containing protein [soil metagenome]
MGCGTAQAAVLLDDFKQPALWTASATDQVKAGLRRDAKAGLCLDYDFGSVSGYVVMRRALPVSWPENFDLLARLSGTGGVNDVQVKLVDASGDNVWWMRRPNMALPSTTTELAIHRRQIGFAWGPGLDRSLRQTQFVEFVVSAGRDGGRGALCLDRLSLKARAPDPVPWPAPVRSTAVGVLQLDYGVPREFNGVVLRWRDLPAAYELQASDDGKSWRPLRKSPGGSALFLPDSEARFLRVLTRSKLLPELSLRTPDAWPTFNAMLAELARVALRGDMPRSFLGEQNYWTLVGVDGGGQRSALISEDGALEIGRGGFSVEPSVQVQGGKPITWAGVTLTQSLREAYLPQPGVRWQHPAFTLDIDAAADGPAGAPELLARYRLRNTSSHRQTFVLTLAVRPWQVNPPQQFLSTPGGAVDVATLRWQGDRLSVNNGASIWPVMPAQAGIQKAGEGASVQSAQAGALDASLRWHDGRVRVTALRFDDGLSLEALATAPALTTLTDPQRHASAALQFRLTLAPSETRALGFIAGMGRSTKAPSGAALDARFDAAAAAWRERLNRVQIGLPAPAQPLIDTLRTSLAHILMSRDGAALRPGTRSYARSWVRDGAMMVAGLLRLGEVAPAREFVDWYGGHIFADGKVPCCVDQRGADPVVENDSHGQYLYAVAEVWRHTHDSAFLARHWLHVQRVMGYLESLRQSERTPLNQLPERAHLFGLMPPSISHESYSDKAAYSFWDDFWALRGYKDGVLIADAMGSPETALTWTAWRDQFQRELAASISATAERFKMTTLAGAADRGDVDPTSSTMALTPAEAQDVIPPALLSGTFERYWADAKARADGSKPWKDYTPYELRNVSALLRLRQPERAHAMLDFFFKDQRPAGWNQWAEVVLPRYRQVGFLGDMPHAWVSSDYIRAALDLLAYDTENPAGLVIGAGLKPGWLAEGDVVVRGLSTAFGPLDYRLLKTACGWTLHLDRAGAPARLIWQGESVPLPPAPSHVDLTMNGDPICPRSTS